MVGYPAGYAEVRGMVCGLGGDCADGDESRDELGLRGDVVEV